MNYKLNAFQQLMLRWETLAPYNACHMVKIVGKPDQSKWQLAITNCLVDSHIGHAKIASNQSSVQFTPESELSIKIYRSSVDDVLTQEFNRAFTENSRPLRCFIIEAKEAYYFGLTYRRWLADSYSMRDLMTRILANYFDRSVIEKPLALLNPEFDTLFGHCYSRFKLGSYVHSLLYMMRKFSRAYRVFVRDKEDFTTRVVSTTLSIRPTELSSISKHYGVTVNDLVTSLLLKVFGELTQEERCQISAKLFRKPRTHIAVGTIVDIRRDAKMPIDHCFGQYLSSYTVVSNKPETQSFKQLVEKIGEQTRHFKKSFRAVKNFLMWRVAILSWDRCPTRLKQARLFHKSAPILAGISNVNMNKQSGVAKQLGSLPIADYLRYSPTGPLTPMAFTLTSFRDSVYLAISYRTTVFTNEQVQQIRMRWIQLLEKEIQLCA